jgi:threonyl-tRNA synthetase
MVHRAVLGSVERMMAVLAEHYAVVDQQQNSLTEGGAATTSKIEVVGAKWPFWLSPRQAMVIVVDANCPIQINYARSIAANLSGRKLDDDNVNPAASTPSESSSSSNSTCSVQQSLNNFYVDVDTSKNSTLNKRIRDAVLAQYNYILIVGDAEVKQGRVSVRKNISTSGTTGKGVANSNSSMTLAQVINLFSSEVPVL